MNDLDFAAYATSLNKFRNELNFWKLVGRLNAGLARKSVYNAKIEVEDAPDN